MDRKTHQILVALSDLDKRSGGRRGSIEDNGGWVAVLAYMASDLTVSQWSNRLEVAPDQIITVCRLLGVTCRDSCD